jgi:hypothetical protein
MSELQCLLPRELQAHTGYSMACAWVELMSSRSLLELHCGHTRRFIRSGLASEDFCPYSTMRVGDWTVGLSALRILLCYYKMLTPAVLFHRGFGLDPSILHFHPGQSSLHGVASIVDLSSLVVFDYPADPVDLYLYAARTCQMPGLG